MTTRSLALLTVLVVTLCVVLQQHAAAGFKCRSDGNADVDWWIAFKYPNPDGRSYSYTDAAAGSSSYTLQRSAGSYNPGSKSSLNYTLSQIYGKPANSLTYVLYNDDPPSAAALLQHHQEQQQQGELAHDDDGYRRRQVDELLAAQKAHAKGIIAFDNTGAGFWLVHSVPKFPVSPSSSGAFQYMDDSQVKYAQSFLCVSFSGWSTWNQVGLQMQYFRPQFYPSSVSTTAQTNVPNLYQAVDFGKYFNTPSTNVVDLRSTGGVTFRSFGKTGYFGTGYDVWDELIAPNLQSAMDVETWRQGSGSPLPSNCTAKYHVENVEYVTMAGITWKYTADHSKWGITSPSSSTWSCVGDINRMASQGNRGGGAVCFQNSGLHKSILASIKSVAPCPN